MTVFHVGRRHASENLASLLEKRNMEKEPPIQIADVLSHSVPVKLKTLLANCPAHAHPKFVDVAWYFPDKCRYVIKALGQVYKPNVIARAEKIPAEQRHKYHQQNNNAIMQELKGWFETQLD